MNTRSIRIAGVAHLAAAALVLFPAPIPAQTQSNIAGQDDIPIFVLDRIELLSSTARIG